MTIFITISKGGIARNLLQNDFYKLVKDKFDKLIIFTPAFKDKSFINEFKSPQVKFLPFYDKFSHGLGYKIYNFFCVYIIYNSSTYVANRYGYAVDRKKRFTLLKATSLMIIFWPLSKILFFKKIMRLIHFYFIDNDAAQYYRKMIKKYKPDIIFAPDIMNINDSALVKAAKKEGVKSIAMTKSWDNFSKRFAHTKADKIVVWGKFMRGQAKRYQLYQDNEIKEVGVPQFDYYIDKRDILSKEEFCQTLNLDPSKKIIVLGSEGKYVRSDTEIARIILDLIKKKQFVRDCQLLIRPHIGHKNELLKFKDFFNKKNAIIDTKKFVDGSIFGDGWDYSRNQMTHFKNIIYHSDVLINTISTLALDGAALNKPTLLIKFDGYKKRKYTDSIAFRYNKDWYRALTGYNSSIEAASIEELRSGINKYLLDPDYKSKERKELIDNFCHKVDGRSGLRIYNYIINNLE